MLRSRSSFARFHGMRKQSVRLFREGLFCCWIEPGEAEEMLESGAADLFFETRAGKKRQIGIEVRGPGTVGEKSPTSITEADMLANVGITEGEGPALPAIVFRAQAKIRAWPTVFDDRAPLTTAMLFALGGGATRDTIEPAESRAFLLEGTAPCLGLRQIVEGHCFQKNNGRLLPQSPEVPKKRCLSVSVHARVTESIDRPESCTRLLLSSGI